MCVLLLFLFYLFVVLFCFKGEYAVQSNQENNLPEHPHSTQTTVQCEYHPTVKYLEMSRVAPLLRQAAENHSPITIWYKEVQNTSIYRSIRSPRENKPEHIHSHPWSGHCTLRQHMCLGQSQKCDSLCSPLTPLFKEARTKQWSHEVTPEEHIWGPQETKNYHLHQRHVSQDLGLVMRNAEEKCQWFI